MGLVQREVEAAGISTISLSPIWTFTAAAGAGLGWLELKNLSRGDTHFTPVPGLQAVPLGLNPTGADATNPALWEGVWLHFEGATYGLDNIEVGSGLAWAVPYGSGCGSPARGGNAAGLPASRRCSAAPASTS